MEIHPENRYHLTALCTINEIIVLIVYCKIKLSLVIIIYYRSNILLLLLSHAFESMIYNWQFKIYSILHLENKKYIIHVILHYW
jgi:hypothetical protein